MTTRLLIAVLIEVPVCTMTGLYVTHRIHRVYAAAAAVLLARRGTDLAVALEAAEKRITEDAAKRVDILAESAMELADATRSVLASVTRPAVVPVQAAAAPAQPAVAPAKAAAAKAATRTRKVS